VPELQNFEIEGNSGVINSDPILTAGCSLSNTLNSATYVDLDIPIQNIRPLTTTKRLAYKFIATGVSGGSYTKGNYLVSSTDTTAYGLIVEEQVILAGTQILYISDMTKAFPNQNNYKEQDTTLTDTGITSTGLQVGDNTDNMELYYYDKDPHDLQFGIGISFINDSKDEEIRFSLSYDDGTGYVIQTDSEIQTSNVKDNRAYSTTLTYIQKMKRGDKIKIVYRYEDNTDTTIQTINFNAK
jgi:hypothetical protein